MFAHWSMNPLTPSTFDEIPLLVVGIPYKSWRHAGVIVDAHDDGTDASDDRFAVIFGGVVNDGPDDAIAKLIRRENGHMHTTLGSAHGRDRR